jgi:arylsulfatase A-like enzyme
MAAASADRRRPMPALVGLVAFALLAGACGGGEGDEPARPEAKPQPQPAPGLADRPTADPDAPNVVVVMSDDQSLASFTPRYMPQTFRDVVGPGTRMRNGLAAPPLCCPARAGFLTGQYPHNHGVFSNSKGYLQLKDPERVLPVWLQEAGYVTGFVGKPLNGYNRLGSTSASPGFDHWFANFGGRATYYDYDIAEDGEVRHYGTDTDDYLTNVLSELGLDFITEASKRERPFFLWLAQYAPHRHAPPDEVAERIPSCANSVPTPRTEADYQRYADEPLPPGFGPAGESSYDEADVSDKQGEIAELPRIDAKTQGFVEERWRCTLAAVRTLDQTVGDLVDHLRELGELDETVIVYISDNGYFFGEHRLATGKGWYYREATEVPFAVRVPPSLRGDEPQPARSDELVANIDLAPTLLDYANARPCIGRGKCRELDGRSLRGLLAGEADTPGRRGALIELAGGCLFYEAIRTERYVFGVPASGHPDRCELAPELYDLRADPAQLENLARDPRYRDVRSRLAHRLNRLTQCSGTSGPEACE